MKYMAWRVRHFLWIFFYHLEPITLLHGRSTGSLDDITFEDDTELHRELDNFFGSGAEVR